MNRNTPVSQIMSTDLITLTLNDDLVTAEKLFKKHHIRHIPVVNGKKLLGIISYTDLLRISFVDAVFDDEPVVESEVYNMFTLEQVMVKKLVTVPPNTSIRGVAKILAKKEFHALPIIENEALIGIVSTTDLINYMLKHFE